MGGLWGQEPLSAREIGGAGPVPIGGDVNHNVAGGAETFEIVKSPGAKYVVLRGEAGTHRIRAGKLSARTFTADNATNEFTATAHGYMTGDGPLRVSNSGGALPAGLSANTDYWVVRTGANTFKLAISHALATRVKQTGPNQAVQEDPITVDITTNGTGTQSIGGNQGSGQPVGFAPTAAPAADVPDGGGSVLLAAGEVVLFSGRAVTVRATAASAMLTWHEV